MTSYGCTRNETALNTIWILRRYELGRGLKHVGPSRQKSIDDDEARLSR